MTLENNDNDMIEIYKGNYYSKHKKNRAKRVVVFDLDETLGSFVDLEILWELIIR
jgi:predicted secreted acid phosphatase